jgi:protein transport protein SEC23
MDTIKRFLLPLAECEFSLNSIMDDLQPDPWIIPPGERPQRATGTALNIAISILEACPFEGPRIVMFTGGPCTVGPGQVVGLKLEDTLRSYNDISKDNDLCKYMKKASKYYQDLSKRAIKSQQVVDIYGFTVDQFGLLEMVSIPK